MNVEKSLTKCNIVQLEKFYSELSQPVASDIDFEYLLIFMMITLMKMMAMMRTCTDCLYLFLRGNDLEAKFIF